MTRFSEIPPLWQTFESRWQFFDWFLSILPNCEPKLANVLCIWAIFKMAKYWKNVLVIWSDEEFLTRWHWVSFHCKGRYELDVGGHPRDHACASLRRRRRWHRPWRRWRCWRRRTRRRRRYRHILSYFSSGPIITCSIVQRSRGFATINRSSSSTSFKAGCAQPSNWFQFPVSRISLKQWTNSFRFQFFIIIISICLEVLLFLGRYCKKSVGPNALSLSLSLRYPSSLTF